MPIAAVLKQVPFFAQLSIEQLAVLEQRGTVTAIAAGEFVFRQGDQADTMVVLLTGTIRVYLQNEEGNEVTLQQCEVGDYIGELALLDDQPRSATALCLSDCALFALPRDAFRQLLIAEPTIMFGVLAALTRRIRSRTEEYYQSQLAQQLIEREAELERHRALAQMVAGVAHEINTPLGVAHTAADMIAKRLHAPLLTTLIKSDPAGESLWEEAVEAATLLTNNLLRAHKLVQNFKKVAVNQLTDTLETVALPPLIEDIVALFKINARQAGLTITIENRLPAEAAAWQGYPGYLTQVLLNLLTNIERYAYPNQQGGPITIVLATVHLGKKPAFQIAVSDYGQGIAPADLPHVFEPFFTTGRAQGGTGLGMAIVYNLVTQALHGTLQIESTPAQGTTVTVTLPTVLINDVVYTDSQSKSRGIHE